MKTKTLVKKCRWALKNKELSHAQASYLREYIQWPTTNNVILSVVMPIIKETK